MKEELNKHNNDEYNKMFMKEALKEAKKAYAKNEVPVGVVLVKDGKIVSRGHNNKENKNDPMGHAEIIAVNKYCKKYNKSYLIEVTGFAFESLWYHSFLGKFFAIPREIKLKRALINAPYAVYVTEKALQKRYPCKGESLGCSDVELNSIENEEIIKARIDKIDRIKENSKIVLGTAAFLDVKCKGHKDVIKAIYLLKKKNKNLRFEYQMIGGGTRECIKETY